MPTKAKEALGQDLARVALRLAAARRARKAIAVAHTKAVNDVLELEGEMYEISRALRALAKVTP